MNGEDIQVLESENTGSSSTENNNQEILNDENIPPNNTENPEEIQKRDNNFRAISQLTQEKNVCPICLDSWTSMGIHRVCALKCGHIFGRSCIEKWLKSKLKNQTSCPQCNTKARRSDIINLYITSLSAVDNSVIEQLKNEFHREKRAKLNIQRSNQHMNLKLNMLVTELDILKSENINLKRKLSLMIDGKMESVENLMSSINYIDFKNFTICKQNGCRIMTVHPNNKFVFISKLSENQNLFPGYGICKFNLDLIDCKNYSTEYVRLHKNRIRDLSLSPYDPSNLLSCSLDRTIRITNLNSNSCVQEYLNQNPIWSCMWDSDNSSAIYAGLANGSIVMYDTRNTSEVVCHIDLKNMHESQAYGSPVVSLKPIYAKKSDSNRIHGIVAATFDNVYFIEKDGENHKPNIILQPVGRIVSVDTDISKEYCVVSQRPRDILKNCQQMVGEIIGVLNEQNINSYKFNLKNTFDGSVSQSLLNRSSMFSPTNDNNIYVAFGNEDKCAIQICHLTSQRSVLISSKYGHIVDLAPVWFQDWHYLLGLTENNLTLYKYVV